MQPMKINYDLLRQKAGRFRSVAENLRQMRGAIGLEIGCLNWDLKCQFDIENRMTDAAKSSERLAAMSDELALRLERTITLLLSAEESPGGQWIKIGPYIPPIKRFPQIPPVFGLPGIVAPIVGGIRWIGDIIRPIRPPAGKTLTPPLPVSPDVEQPPVAAAPEIPNYDASKNYYEKGDFKDCVVTDGIRGIKIDSFNGVDAYITEGNVGDSTYTKGIQCSDYIKRYYSSTYQQNGDNESVKNVIINDLLPNGYTDDKGNVHDGVPNFSYTNTSKTPEVRVTGEMELVTTPKPGDVYAGADGEHWAIVKAVEGDKVIVIEQNAGFNDPQKRWSVPINQRYAITGHKFYRMPTPQ